MRQLIKHLVPAFVLTMRTKRRFILEVFVLQMCSFLEREFLDEQVKDMKDLSDKVSQLRLVGHGMGEFLFDKEAFESH